MSLEGMGRQEVLGQILHNMCKGSKKMSVSESEWEVISADEDEMQYHLKD